MKRGSVVVAQKPGRGSSYKYPAREGFTRVDVTSGSFKSFGLHKATGMSPLYLGPITDCDGDKALRFENMWQFRKVYPQLGHWDEATQRPTKAWDVWRRAGNAKLNPKGKGIRTPYEVSKLRKLWREKKIPAWTPVCMWWQNEALDYVTSRKRVYVPAYAALVAENDAFKAMKALVDAGENIMVLDLDGPPLSLYPSGLHVTEDSLTIMLNDPNYPFGHGYVVAALLANIDLDALCVVHKKTKI